MENLWDRSREEFINKGAKHVHTLEDLTISNLPDVTHSFLVNYETRVHY